MPERGVSGVAVGVMVVGAIFTYAAVKGKSLSDAVRVLTGGKSASFAQQSLGIGAVGGGEYLGGTITGKLSDTQLAQLAATAGWAGSDRTIAVAVALAESGGKVTATHRNANGSEDIGLWQVNSVHGFSSAQLLTAEGNARAAHSVWTQQGWRGWTTYTTGAYLLYMPRAKLVT